MTLTSPACRLHLTSFCSLFSCLAAPGWNCPKCTMKNALEAKRCNVCNALAPEREPQFSLRSQPCADWLRWFQRRRRWTARRPKAAAAAAAAPRPNPPVSARARARSSNCESYLVFEAHLLFVHAHRHCACFGLAQAQSSQRAWLEPGLRAAKVRNQTLVSKLLPFTADCESVCCTQVAAVPHRRPDSGAAMGGPGLALHPAPG